MGPKRAATLALVASAALRCSSEWKNTAVRYAGPARVVLETGGVRRGSHKWPQRVAVY